MLWGLLILGFAVILYPQNPFYTPNEKPTPLVDAYMTNATALRYNPDGSIKERLAMKTWQHVLKSQSTEMQTLALDLFRKDGTIWRITSDHGSGYHPSINAKIEYVLLTDNVNVFHQDEILGTTDWNLTTESLMVYPDFAHTDLPVQVQGPDNTQISAVGLKAHLETGYVEFLDQVKTEYLSQKAL